jgi:hypothetical protein
MTPQDDDGTAGADAGAGTPAAQPAAAPPSACNPVWTAVQLPSTLRMALEIDGNPGISGLLVTAPNAGGPAHSRSLSADDFPLSEPVQAGTSSVVMLTVSSTGEAGMVTVTSLVTGADARGPDVCPLAVDEANPFAFSNTTVSGA